MKAMGSIVGSFVAFFLPPPCTPRTSRPFQRMAYRPVRSLPPPVPEWARTHLRVGHLPGTGRMAAEFLKAGYDVVIVNALRKWDIVGPSAALYSKEEVEAAGRYLRGDPRMRGVA